MRFEFYHSGLDDTPKLSVDGTVSNSIHFSHWKGNETPAEVMFLKETVVKRESSVWRNQAGKDACAPEHMRLH